MIATSKKERPQEFVAHGELPMRNYNPVATRTTLHFNEGSIGDLLIGDIRDAFRVKELLESQGIDPNTRISDIVAINRNSLDPVAAEITREVTIKWADRKLPGNKGQPWAKDSVAFIRHWYGKWLNAGLLTRAHLRHDSQLYSTYTAYLRRCDETGKAPALYLEAEARVFLSDPLAALKRKRKSAANWAQRSRSAKIK